MIDKSGLNEDERAVVESVLGADAAEFLTTSASNKSLSEFDTSDDDLDVQQGLRKVVDGSNWSYWQGSTDLGFYAGVKKISNCEMEPLRPCSVKMDNNDKIKQKRGALVVLEGLDRSGKSSQASKLVSYLESVGVSSELWRFPDRSTTVGSMVSSYLTNNSQLDDHTIHLLFSANRWEKRSLMEEKLKGGTNLIVDRYSYSGVAFSSAKGLSHDWCKAPEIGLVAPDLVLYLEIAPEKAAERGGYGGERYEQLDFQRNVADKYRLLYDPTWKIIDASLSPDEVHDQIRNVALEHVTECQNGKSLSHLWSD